LSAAGDGLGLVGAGERCHGKHCRQRHEQADYGFAHHNSLSIAFSASADHGPLAQAWRFIAGGAYVVA
jgi:hypothetical protein